MPHAIAPHNHPIQTTHSHAGETGDGGSFDAANLASGASADGYVLTSDGAGGAGWEEPVASVVMTARNDPTGFPNRTASSISFTDGTLTFQIAPTAASFTFYSAGVLYTKTAQTKIIANTAGLHYIYFDTSGVIQESTSVWDISSANVPVACVYWNGSAGLLMDERHGIQMDGMTHEWIHETKGAAYASGMAGTFAADGSTITIGLGEWYDDDIEYVTTEKTQCRVFYLNGTAWNWTAAQASYFHAVSSVPQYNNSGALADVDVSKYSISWVYMTNMTTTPIAVIMGQAQYNTQALAEAAGVPNLASFPAPEMLLLYKVIWQRNGAVIAWKRTDDYRRVAGGPASSYLATDHGALAGLTDPDHPASAITVDTSTFNGALSAADDTVQKALATLDDASGGILAFTDLTDVPASYADEGGKLVRVNVAEDGLEFIDPPAGTGDVVGPASSTNGNLALFDGTTGKLLKDGGALPAAGATIYTSAAASPPASPASGDAWMPSDGVTINRYSGSIWAPWGPVYPFTKPVLGDFSWVNQSTATATDEYGAISMYATATTWQMRILEKAVPAAPYTVTAAFSPGYHVRQDYIGFGMVLHDSTGTKIVDFGLYSVSGVLNFYGEKLNDYAGGGAATYFGGVPIYPLSPIWFRINDNNTNRLFLFSLDGQHFYQLYSVGRTDFITPNKIGVFITTRNTTYPMAMNWMHWKET